MTEPSAYLCEAESRGLKFQASGMKLMVSPRALLTDADRQAITQHKAKLLELLQERRTCCTICPGADHELCAGCPTVEEYLMPDGLIVSGWCVNGLDVQTATHVRNRWNGEPWRKIGSEIEDAA